MSWLIRSYDEYEEQFTYADRYDGFDRGDLDHPENWEDWGEAPPWTPEPGAELLVFNLREEASKLTDAECARKRWSAKSPELLDKI